MTKIQQLVTDVNSLAEQLIKELQNNKISDKVESVQLSNKLLLNQKSQDFFGFKHEGRIVTVQIIKGENQSSPINACYSYSPKEHEFVFTSDPLQACNYLLGKL